MQQQRGEGGMYAQQEDARNNDAGNQGRVPRAAHALPTKASPATGRLT